MHNLEYKIRNFPIHTLLPDTPFACALNALAWGVNATHLDYIIQNFTILSGLYNPDCTSTDYKITNLGQNLK